MNTIKYYLGIDGGGTKTEFVLCHESGNIINRYITNGCNPNDKGFDICLATVIDGCTKVSKDLNRGNISVFAGIAGAGNRIYSEKIKNELYACGFAQADCSSDTKLAVASTLDKKDGITVIIGTGTAIIIQKNREQQIIGGYNYLFDKGGSAYNFGRDAIFYSLTCEDRNIPETPLYKSVMNKCNTESIKENLNLFYHKGKSYIAEFAHCVTETYYSDNESVNITDKNMYVIAEQINHALTICETDDIYFTGGMTSQGEIFKPHLLKYLNKPCNLIFYNGSLTKGALKLAGMENESC